MQFNKYNWENIGEGVYQHSLIGDDYYIMLSPKATVNFDDRRVSLNYFFLNLSNLTYFNFSEIDSLVR